MDTMRNNNYHHKCVQENEDDEYVDNMDRMRNKYDCHHKYMKLESDTDDKVDNMDRMRNTNNYHHKYMKVRKTTM